MPGELGAAAGGAISLQDVLRAKFAEALQQQKLQEDMRQANMQHQIQQQQVGLGGRRIDEDARQFGVTSDQGQQRINLDTGEQPLKLRLMGAQAGEIERKPQAELEARDFTTNRDKTQHGYGLETEGVQGAQRMREIAAQGQNALRVANVRHPDPATGPTQREQNEIQDSLDLVNEIRNDKALSTSTGPIQGRGFGMLQDLEGYTRVKAHHDNLVNKLALAQAGKLKGQGPVSNFERDMLKSAATALDMKLGDPDYLNELKKVEAQFRDMLTRSSAGPRTAGPQGGGNLQAGGAVGQEFDYVPGKGLVPRK